MVTASQPWYCPPPARQLHSSHPVKSYRSRSTAQKIIRATDPQDDEHQTLYWPLSARIAALHIWHTSLVSAITPIWQWWGWHRPHTWQTTHLPTDTIDLKINTVIRAKYQARKKSGQCETKKFLVWLTRPIDNPGLFCLSHSSHFPLLCWIIFWLNYIIRSWSEKIISNAVSRSNFHM